MLAANCCQVMKNVLDNSSREGKGGVRLSCFLPAEIEIRGLERVGAVRTDRSAIGYSEIKRPPQGWSFNGWGWRWWESYNRPHSMLFPSDFQSLNPISSGFGIHLGFQVGQYKMMRSGLKQTHPVCSISALKLRCEFLQCLRFITASQTLRHLWIP